MDISKSVESIQKTLDTAKRVADNIARINAVRKTTGPVGSRSVLNLVDTDNVDLATNITELLKSKDILTANLHTIRTIDEMQEELLHLKRP